jgi:hypothetical protein
MINKKGDVIEAIFNDEKSDPLSNQKREQFKQSTMKATFNKVIFGKKTETGIAKFEFIKNKKKRR